jgi:hypothetical protein
MYPIVKLLFSMMREKAGDWHEIIFRMANEWERSAILLGSSILQNQAASELGRMPGIIPLAD